METRTISLNVHPQIIDLYEALEKNGLHKQKEDVQSLVGYIENMEYNLSVMMNEIQEMHAEVNLLHDKGIRAKCAKIVTKAEDKILQIGTMVSVAKCKELSLYDTGVSAAYGDKLITLSTCEYSQTNGRMVVVAKKVASPQAEVAGNET